RPERRRAPRRSAARTLGPRNRAEVRRPVSCSLPGTMVSAKRVRATLRKLVEPVDDLRWRRPTSTDTRAFVERTPQQLRNVRHIGGRALTTLDFDRLHAALDQCRQDIERVETRRLLDRMIRVAFDFEATLAERRIPRRLAGRIAVYEHAAEAGLQAFRRFEPSDRVGGRAYPVRVRRLPGHVRGERATSF